MRETTEELGIEPAAIEVLGLLDDVPTPTRFVITPVVARLRGPLTMAPNPAEVASVFSPPSRRRSPIRRATRPTASRTFLGITYEMHEYRWEPHRIWGATARMVYQLMTLLAMSRADEPQEDERSASRVTSRAPERHFLGSDEARFRLAARLSVGARRRCCSSFALALSYALPRVEPRARRRTATWRCGWPASRSSSSASCSAGSASSPKRKPPCVAARGLLKTKR